MIIHKKEPGGKTLCGIEKSKRWLCKNITSNGNWDSVTCFRCEDRRHDAIIGSLLAAIADTHPKDGDVEQAPLVSGGGGVSQSPNLSHLSIQEGTDNGE